MPVTVVLSAHGALAKPTHNISLPVMLTTSCGVGAVYAPQHLQFDDLRVFSDLGYLHKYAAGTDYTTRGRVIPPGEQFESVVLSPFPPNDPNKDWSWQKPCVLDHLKKMFIHELADAKGVVLSAADVKSIGHHGNFLKFVRQHAPLTGTLKVHLDTITKYSSDTQHDIVDVDAEHTCSLTETKCISGAQIYMLDYEVGPSNGHGGKEDNWNIEQAVEAINHYLSTACSVDLTGVDYILQACLVD
jgi:hypothetical protein